MKTLLPALILGLCVTGCNKPKPEEAPAPAAPTKPAPASVETSAAPAADAQPATAGEPGAEEPGLASLNAAVNAYSMGQLKEPATLEELVKAGYIKRVPNAPPGKKYSLNANRTAVIVVDK